MPSNISRRYSPDLTNIAIPLDLFIKCTQYYCKRRSGINQLITGRSETRWRPQQIKCTTIDGKLKKLPSFFDFVSLHCGIWVRVNPFLAFDENEECFDIFLAVGQFVCFRKREALFILAERGDIYIQINRSCIF